MDVQQTYQDLAYNRVTRRNELKMQCLEKRDTLVKTLYLFPGHPQQPLQRREEYNHDVRARQRGEEDNQGVQANQRGEEDNQRVQANQRGEEDNQELQANHRGEEDKHGNNGQDNQNEPAKVKKTRSWFCDIL